MNSKSLIITTSIQLHARAMEAAIQYRRWEAELLDLLDQIERRRVYLECGVSSLYAYCTQQLKLSESVSYNLIAVMRKSREVPELREQTRQGAITLSNARRVASVLTSDNQSEWLARASTLSARALEKEIARVHPQSQTPERAVYVTESRVRLELGLSEDDMLRLRRAQDLVSQSKGKPASLEETCAAMTELFLSRRCPVERARRITVKKSGSLVSSLTASQGSFSADLVASVIVDDSANSGVVVPACTGEPSEQGQLAPARTGGSIEHGEAAPARTGESNASAGAHHLEVPGKDSVMVADSGTSEDSRRTRSPIPAAVLHAVNLRDGGGCTFRFPSGKRCSTARFLEIHHLVPVAQGGSNSLENLVTLCGAHHRYLHRSV